MVHNFLTRQEILFMKLQQHLNQYINIYLQRECRKTTFIHCFIVTAKNLIWLVVFYFSVHCDRQRNNIYLQHCVKQPPIPLFLRDNIKVDGILTKIQWKLHPCFGIISQVLKVLLIKIPKISHQIFYSLLFYISFYISRHHFS